MKPQNKGHFAYNYREVVIYSGYASAVFVVGMYLMHFIFECPLAVADPGKYRENVRLRPLEVQGKSQGEVPS